MQEHRSISLDLAGMPDAITPSTKGDIMATRVPTHRFTAQELRRLRRSLEKRRRQLLRSESSLEHQGLKDLTEEATDEISHIRTHPADLGTMEYDQRLALYLAEEEIKELQDIEHALVKMKNERYGVCEDCGADIPLARLEAIPYTRYCGDCELKIEERKKQLAQKNRVRDI